MRTISLVSLITFLFILYSCHSPAGKTVIFTFDDHYIDSWYKSQSLFSKYGIKATFYVNRPATLTHTEEALLKQMKMNGHEIGCHGMNHLNAEEFLKSNSIDSYLKNEVIPAVTIMDAIGLNIRSYAYPFGKHSGSLDSALLNYFGSIRLATYKWEKSPLDSINRLFLKSGSTGIANALSIDKDLLELSDIEKAITRAEINNETIVFLAHGIDSVDGLYVSSKYLEEVFKICARHHIHCVTMNEYFKPASLSARAGGFGLPSGNWFHKRRNRH